MYLIPGLIALEILIGVLTAQPVRSGDQANIHQQENLNVLGEADNLVAQEPPTDTPEPPPDQPPTAAQTEPLPPPPQEVTQTEPLPPPPQEVTQTEPLPPPPQEVTQTEQQQVPSQEVTQTTNLPTEEPTNLPPEQKVGTSAQVLNSAVFPNLTETSPSDQLVKQTINEVKNENEQLDNAKTPQEQSNLLVQFETKNVQTLNTNMNTSQFNDLAFSADRLSSQIDKTVDISQNLSPKDAQEFRNEIDTICKNTEYLLRPGELVVPEGVEQSLEVTRGKCFNFEKQ